MRIHQRLRILIRNIRRDPHHRAGKPPGFQRATLPHLQMANERCTIDALFERTHFRREALGEHRHDAVGEVHTVPAPPRLAVKARSGADVERDVGNRDNRFPAAFVGRVIVGCRPDGIVMIARVSRIDRDDREVAQVFPPRAQRLPRNPHRFVQRFGRKHVGNAEFMDRDQ